MKNKLKNKPSFIALLVLLAMAFNACSNPAGSETKVELTTPEYGYVDSNGNIAETDSGRTVVVADKKAKAVFYSDNYASDTQRVGFAYGGKTMLFFFEKNQNFPTSIVMSGSGEPVNGIFSPYDSATQTYSLTVEQGGDQATLSDIALKKDIFTQYKDDPGFSSSQNLRMHNLYIAMRVYKSLDAFLASDNAHHARGIWNFANKVLQVFFPGPITEIVVGGIGFYVEANSFMSTSNPFTMKDNISGMQEATNLIVNGINKLTTELFFVAVTGITGVPTTAPVGNLALSGTVTPSNATNKIIAWSVKSSGTTGAKISGNNLTTTAAGTVTVMATIANGKAAGSPYTKDFPISITTTSTNNFVAVTGITGVLTTAPVGSLALSGTVAPTNATNKIIVWTIKSSGTTGATITGSTLKTIAAGTVTVTATIANGKAVGTPYTQDFTITVTSATTYTVTYNANGGTGIAPSAQTAASGTSITIPGQGNLVYSGRIFGGWNTSANGTGTAYAAGSSLTVTANITLYAQWVTSSKTYTVSYNANGGSGTVPSPQTVVQGTILALAGQGNLSKSGMTFGGWNSSADGMGATYAAGSSMTVNADITLYARWVTASTATYTVTFDANGGSGTVPPPQTVAEGTSITLPGPGNLSFPGKILFGWRIISSYSNLPYYVGESYAVYSDITLVAIWSFPAPNAAPTGLTGKATIWAKGGFYVYISWNDDVPYADWYEVSTEYPNDTYWTGWQSVNGRTSHSEQSNSSSSYTYYGHGVNIRVRACTLLGYGPESSIYLLFQYE